MSANDQKLIQAYRAVRPHRISALVVSILIIGFVVLGGWLRYSDFREYQQELANSTAKGAASEITRYIVDLQRQLAGFAYTHAGLLSRVATGQPGSDDQIELESMLDAAFPQNVNYSIASKTGWPITQEEAMSIGNLCKDDIRSFAQKKEIPVNFHPGPEGDHFDIMTAFKNTAGEKNIFFISLAAESLSPILASHNLPDYQIFLTTRATPNVIDISSEGSRQYIQHSRELSENEIKRVNGQVEVSQTNWQLVMVPDRIIFTNQLKKILMYSLASLVVLGILGIIIFRLIIKSHQTLKREQQHYQQLFTDIKIPMVLIDPDNGNIIDANIAAVSFYGHSLESLKQHDISFISTNSYPEVRQKINEVMRRGR